MLTARDPLRLAALLALLAAPAFAAGLEPSRFGLSNAERGRLFLSPDKATPGFERLERDLVLHAPEGAFGPGRSVRVETTDGRAGWVEGRHVSAFDRAGLYLADLSTGAVRRIRGVAGAVDISIPNDLRAFALERATGRLFAIDLRAATADLLFPGGPEAAEAEGHRILCASPDGRFVAWNAERGPDRLPVTRLLDARGRDVVTVRPTDLPPASFGGDGSRVLWGPDPWDGGVRLLPADRLVAEVAMTRGTTPDRPKAGGSRHAELSRDGSRFLRLRDDLALEVIDAATGRALWDAREVGHAAFLPDGRVFVRRPDGYTLYSRDGRPLGGPWLATGSRDLPLLSPDGAFAMFVSRAGRDTRFRVGLELATGRVIHAVSDMGGEPILLNPRFAAKGPHVFAEGGRLDLATGIFWRDERLDGFRPDRLAARVNVYLTIGRDGRYEFREPVTGALIRSIPFPGGFAPRQGPDPCLVLLAAEGR